MDFLDFVYQTARVRYPKGYLNSPDAVRVDDPVLLQQLMAVLTMDGEMPILLHIGEQIFDYHSYLKMAGGMGHTDKSLYLLIDALTPPIGNVRIRHADIIVISLNTQTYNVVMEVNFIERLGGNVLKITFPREVIVRTEKRKSVRVNIDSAWNIVLEVAVGRKEAFKPRLENVSYGGFYFKAQNHHPKLASGDQHTVHFIWPSMKIETRVNTTLIETCSKNGDPFFRARFTFEIYDKSMQQIESLVASAQSMHLQRRKALFGYWELNLEKKGH
ncbi:MAG: hypothetical protein HQL84_04640 [Magnetococcales bacterium]|nr:hypothetical protein [Magnetococcales bacterium]MBF0149316.1 hypothetical protein [Magnetococcales bacterium]MBF0172327.1 hypothetical protein [Magnetococcales bacterium]MBF0348527.1 hypothetical protein [Magnetococcales bacterium]MBF0630656.1 hypothetical protein [Magnetococcales bacterium]